MGSGNSIPDANDSSSDEHHHQQQQQQHRNNHHHQLQQSNHQHHRHQHHNRSNSGSGNQYHEMNDDLPARVALQESLMEAQKSVSSFLKEAMSTNMNMSMIQTFLQDKQALRLYKQFVFEMLENDEEAIKTIEHAVVLNQDELAEEDHVKRLAPLLVLTTFKRFLDSTSFAQWVATKEAGVLSMAIKTAVLEEGSLSALPSDRSNVVTSRSSKASGSNNNYSQATAMSAAALAAEAASELAAIAAEDANSTTINSSNASLPTATAAAAAAAAVVVAATNTTTSSKKSTASARTASYKHAAITCIMDMDFVKVMVCDSWLTTLIAGVDSLPISFSISSADPKKYGFPIIYVNKYFERLTGYRRSEMIGKNCSLLQTCAKNIEANRKAKQANQSALKRLGVSLSLGIPIAVELDNFRKDGTLFRNHLIMKPLFDQYNSYRYVIGLQCEIKEDQQEKQIESVRNLFQLLPDQVYIEDDEDGQI